MILCVCPVLWMVSEGDSGCGYCTLVVQCPHTVHPHQMPFFFRDGKDKPLSPLPCTARTLGTIYILRCQFYKALQSRAIMPLKIIGGKTKVEVVGGYRLNAASTVCSLRANFPLLHRTGNGWLASKFLTHFSFSITIILTCEWYHRQAKGGRVLLLFIVSQQVEIKNATNERT